MNKWDYRFMEVAKLVSTWSYCKRLQVGAVLVHDRRILSTGYNGNLQGFDNCCEENNKTKDSVVHAEENVIMQCIRNGIALPNDCTLYCTHFPCYHCAKLILNSNKIKTLIYLEDYNENESMTILKHIKIIKL